MLGHYKSVVQFFAAKGFNVHVAVHNLTCLLVHGMCFCPSKKCPLFTRHPRLLTWAFCLIIAPMCCCRWIDAGKFLTGFSAIGSIAVPAILFHAQVWILDHMAQSYLLLAKTAAGALRHNLSAVLAVMPASD